MGKSGSLWFILSARASRAVQRKDRFDLWWRRAFPPDAASGSRKPANPWSEATRPLDYAPFPRTTVKPFLDFLRLSPLSSSRYALCKTRSTASWPGWPSPSSSTWSRALWIRGARWAASSRKSSRARSGARRITSDRIACTPQPGITSPSSTG
jgi:hypothetical protein